MKFGTMMHISPLDSISQYNLRIVKIQNGKLFFKPLCLKNCLTDLIEIWYADAHWPSGLHKP